MKIEERIKYHKYLLTFKCIKQEAPSYLSNKLSCFRNQSIRFKKCYKCNGNLNVPKPKIELIKLELSA